MHDRLRLRVCVHHHTIRGVNDIERMSGVELTPKDLVVPPSVRGPGHLKGLLVSPPVSVGVIGGQSGGYEGPKSVLSKI